MIPSHSRKPLTLVTGRNRRDVSDSEVAAGLSLGEDWAITEAWHRFAPLVLATAERALGSRSDAEDVTQDVFSGVFRNVKTLRDPASLRSFVYSVAVRTLRSHLRYRKLRHWLAFREPETLLDLRHSVQDVEGREFVESLYRLLDRLSPRDRLVFVLRRVDAMTVEEIASSLGISSSTVKRSFTHASARLSRWIAADPALSERLDRKPPARSG
jgi:RNA polymerase sigma-70 factor (ECF subfamily)